MRAAIVLTALLLLAACGRPGGIDVSRALTSGLLSDSMFRSSGPSEPDRMAIAAAESADEEDDAPSPCAWRSAAARPPPP